MMSCILSSSLASHGTRFRRCADPRDSFAPLRAPCAHTRWSEPFKVMLKDGLHLPCERFHLGLFREFRSLLPLMEAAPAAAIKFLQAELSLGQCGFILVIETAQRVVHLGHGTKAIAQDPPIDRGQKHCAEQEERDTGKNVGRAAPPSEAARIMTKLAMLSGQSLHGGAGRGQPRFGLHRTIGSILLIALELIDLRSEFAFARDGRIPNAEAT